MGEPSSIVNIGDLAKPATALIEKISEAIGGYAKPYQITRVAKAESDATVIKAKAEAEAALVKAKVEIEVTELQTRAIERFVKEEARKQENIESITETALPLLTGTAKPENMEADWIANFFEKCRIVSDVEMQQLWGRVLAGEANAPGSFAKRTVNLIGSIDKQEAISFTNLCRFGFFLGNILPFVYDVQNSVYNNAGVTFDSLMHLQAAGLVSFGGVAGFQSVHLPKAITLFFYGQTITLEFVNDKDNSLDTGFVMLTQAGQQLAPLCGSTPAEGFLDYAIERWCEKGYTSWCPYPDPRRQRLS